MKMELPPIKILLAGLGSILMLHATAQKLPNRQENSLRAPASTAVDGKLDEWGDQLQAYNKQTKFFYTIANDDQFIYFSIRATDPATIQKIISNNITVALFASTDNKKKETTSVTYPALNAQNKRSLASNFKFQVMKADDNNLTDDDSVLKATNNKLKAAGRGKVAGFAVVKEITGKGFNTAAIFNGKNEWTIELAMPVALIESFAATQFHYSITLNGDEDLNVKVTGDGSPYTNLPQGVTGGPNSPSLPSMAKVVEGDYLLAVK